jgi:hypothetical protein
MLLPTRQDRPERAIKSVGYFYRDFDNHPVIYHWILFEIGASFG